MTDLPAHSQPQRDEPSIRTLIEHALIDHGYSPTNARILLDTVISTEQNSAARQTTGQDDTAPAPGRLADLLTLSAPCDTCEHTLNWHRNDVGCTTPACACSQFREPAPAVGQPAEAHDTDRAACACSHPQERHNSACAHCPCIGYAATWPPLTPEEQDAETLAAADTVEDER